MIKLFFLISISLYLGGCDSQKKSLRSNTIYYKDFDMFRLKGTDTLNEIDRSQSVEVRYINDKPISIKYIRPERIVTLLLEDSFIINEKTVYVYATSNFHGGQPGKRKEYSFHYEERKDLLYITLSDTIICKSHKVTNLDYYSYTLYLYIRNNNGGIIEIMSGSNTTEDKVFSKDKLYQFWLNLLINDHLKRKDKPIIEKRLPK